MICTPQIFKRLEAAIWPALVAFWCILLRPDVVLAQEASVGAHLSTLGLGGEATVVLGARLGVRAGYDAMALSFGKREEDIDYDFDVDLQTASIKADLYLANTGFRITAGLVENSNGIRMKAKTQEALEIGAHSYRGDDVGNLVARLLFEKMNWIVTMGIDSSLGKERGFGFVFEAGAIFQDPPRLELAADGPISDDPDFVIDLELERTDIESDFEFFQLYPVVTIGITYHL